MTTQPERVRWAMPRDMSGFSTLEAAMLSAINAAGLPEPAAEYRFDWCCQHTLARHTIMIPGPPKKRWCRDCDAWCRHQSRVNRRAWAFDFAWPALMVAVECEGGTYSGGRHTTGAGFEKDAAKYAEATARGWTVLRFTQRQIHSGEALILLERVMTRLVDVTAAEIMEGDEG